MCKSNFLLQLQRQLNAKRQFDSLIRKNESDKENLTPIGETVPNTWFQGMKILEEKINIIYFKIDRFHLRIYQKFNTWQDAISFFIEKINDLHLKLYGTKFPYDLKFMTWFQAYYKLREILVGFQEYLNNRC